MSKIRLFSLLSLVIIIFSLLPIFGYQQVDAVSQQLSISDTGNNVQQYYNDDRFDWGNSNNLEIEKLRTHTTKTFNDPTDSTKRILIQSSGLLHAYTDKGFQDIETELPDYSFPEGKVLYKDSFLGSVEKFFTGVAEEEKYIMDLPSWGIAELEGDEVVVYDKLNTPIFRYTTPAVIEQGKAPFKLVDKNGNKVRDLYDNKTSLDVDEELEYRIENNADLESAQFVVKNNKLYFKVPEGVKYPLQAYDDVDTGSTNNKDTYLSEAQPTTAKGALTTATVGQGADGTKQTRILISWTLSSDPGGTVTDVSLFMYVGTLGGTPTANIHQLTGHTDWSEANATWNTYDGSNNWTGGANGAGSDYSATVIDSTLVPAATNFQEWILMGAGSDNPLTLDWDSVVHLLIKHSTETGANSYAIYNTKENASNVPYLQITYTPTGVNVQTDAADDLEETTATLNGQVTDDNGETIEYYGFVWDTSDEGDPGDVDPSIPAGTWSNGWKSALGDYGANPFDHAVTGLSEGTTYHFRAAAKGDVSGWVYGADDTFLTKPAAPTNVDASDGTETTKVVLTWTKSTGATGYKIYRDGGLIDTVGDVDTYDDTGAGAPTITPGTVTASDGTSAAHVTLTVAGDSASNGTTHTYKLKASNGTGDSSDSATDTGYRGITTLTYQWLRSAADADAGFGNIGGGTTNPYNDVGGVAYPDGRYYYCEVSMTGAVTQDTTHDRGYMGVAPTVTTGFCTGFGSTWAILNGNITATGYPTAITDRGFDYGLTDAYGSSETESGTFSTGTYSTLITGLSPGTVYHYQAKAQNASGWGDGADALFATKGSPTPYVTYNSGSDNQTCGIYGINWATQTFTTPATYAYTITSVNLYIYRTGNPGDINVYIKRTSGTDPTGEILCSGTIDGDAIDTGANWYQVEMTTETSLEADTLYAIIVSAPSGDAANYICWARVDAGGYADGTARTSANSGTSWTGQAYDFMFEVWGNPCIQIDGAKVFTNYQSSGDWLITILYRNVYPPYYENKDNVKQYFALQLVDSGGTVRSQVACPEWDYKPGSIYLNASQVTALTWGGTYYVRLTGLFTGNPYIEYAIQSEDWVGEDLTKLDDWVLSSADLLGEYYDTTMTTYVADRGKLLNATGGVIFANGITGLSSERPDIFQIYTQPTSHPIGGTSGSGAGETANTWQGMLGTYVTTQLTNAGNVLGTDGKSIGAWILVAVMLALMAWGLPTGHVMPANVLALPIFFMGVGLRLFDWATAAVMIALMLFLLWYNIWMKHG